MKKIILLISIIFTIVLTITMHSSCHKNSGYPYKNSDSACGCGVVRYITYNNYFGNSYDANISYDTLIHPNAWVIGVSVPNMNSIFAMKICNPDFSAIKQITDTISKLNGIPIRSVHVNVAGRMRDMCPDEDSRLGYQGVLLPETSFGYITVDAIEKN
jgi:hypothetical protein